MQPTPCLRQLAPRLPYNPRLLGGWDASAKLLFWNASPHEPHPHAAHMPAMIARDDPIERRPPTNTPALKFSGRRYRYI